MSRTTDAGAGASPSHSRADVITLAHLSGGRCARRGNALELRIRPSRSTTRCSAHRPAWADPGFSGTSAETLPRLPARRIRVVCSTRERLSNTMTGRSWSYAGQPSPGTPVPACPCATATERCLAHPQLPHPWSAASVSRRAPSGPVEVEHREQLHPVGGAEPLSS